MADIKTHLRELSVATVVGLLINNTPFQKNDLYNSKRFFTYAKGILSNDISNASDIEKYGTFTGELKQIIDNGYQLGLEIFNKPHFKFHKSDCITWQGNDTQKDDPVDITIGDYKFSLKEESFILENMGLYKLLNCYTGSHYTKRHIFSDYARPEYEKWFDITWNELLTTLSDNDGKWGYYDTKKGKSGTAFVREDSVVFEYSQGRDETTSVLPINCTLSDYEKQTSSKTREQVFSKYINLMLDANEDYNISKRNCAIAATTALSRELSENLNYKAGLPRFLRIHDFVYYYAKTTTAGVEIFRVPSLSEFEDNIIIESIEGSVPDKQANILTTIKNKKTGQELVLRNECRFSHGQFNGTPEAKMYYERGGSLEIIYEKL